MEGVNNAFCLSKEEYEIARLATKCAGLQGKIEYQAAEIEKYKALCDQMATVMTNAVEHRWPYLDDMRSLIEAGREMK